MVNTTTGQKDRHELRTEFRELLAGDEHIVAPSVHNALTANVTNFIEGFQLLGISGYGVSASSLGLPDVGYITMSEMIENARNIAATADVPVYADLDTGFGNAVNVRRTMREVISNTDVAGAFLEDQLEPKRCGHVAGKRILPKEEAIGKFRAAADIRDEIDEEFVIIARTDARGAVDGGLDEAIARGNAYADAGADVIFVEGPVSIEEVERIGEEVDAPLKYNSTGAAGVSPMLDAETLFDLGFVLSTFTTTRIAIVNLYNHLERVAENGMHHERQFREDIQDHPVGDLHQFSGMTQIRDFEREYLPEEDLRKYDGSLGHDGEEFKTE